MSDQPESTLPAITRLWKNSCKVKMESSEITLYGAHWCPDCRRSKQFLGEHQIPYAWVDNEQDPAAEQFVITKSQGSGVLIDQWEFIATGRDVLHAGERPIGFEKRDPFLLETSIPGIFAAGDVRDTSTMQVVSAAGEGGSAALAIREYLKMV
jgi:glutaredoxin